MSMSVSTKQKDFAILERKAFKYYIATYVFMLNLISCCDKNKTT